MENIKREFDEKFVENGFYNLLGTPENLKSFICEKIKEERAIYNCFVEHHEAEMKHIKLQCADELEEICKSDMSGWEFVGNLIKKWKEIGGVR